MPYHVRITPRSDRSEDEVKLDLTKEQLEERFLRPYREGRPITIGGKTIAPDDIERIHINYTDENSEQLLPTIRAERARSGIIAMISDEWYVTDRGRDVTDDLITGPPGTGVSNRHENAGPRIRGPRVVFVVHGRNVRARDAMFTFLRSVGLYPLEWSEAVAATGQTSPYIGQVLDAAFSIAQAIVVLMTPDDEGHLKESLRISGDPPHEIELTGQARLNVIFEAGMAMGRISDRTVLVELGTLRPFSDIGGRHVVRLDNTTQRRQELANRLQTAGCPAALSGTSWHNAGDFDAALENENQPP
jgi:predicted nucleotide-binding protein